MLFSRQLFVYWRKGSKNTIVFTFKKNLFLFHWLPLISSLPIPAFRHPRIFLVIILLSFIIISFLWGGRTNILSGPLFGAGTYT